MAKRMREPTVGGWETPKQVRKNFGEAITRNFQGQNVYAMTQGQYELVQAIRNNDIIFIDGPAGCGKTFLACSLAIELFDQGEIDKIILTRPLVDAGEEMGFLPGSMEEKSYPYLKPLYESIEKLRGPILPIPGQSQPLGKVEVPTEPKRKGAGGKIVQVPARMSQSDILKKKYEGHIEIAPFAFMRGSTHDKSFVIVDEAANVTKKQMELVLTRMGNGTKIVLCGDMRQCDLPDSSMSGFEHAIKLLTDIDGITCIKLTENDIVRNPLVKEIILKYSKKFDRREGVISNRD